MICGNALDIIWNRKGIFTHFCVIPTIMNIYNKSRKTKHIEKITLIISGITDNLIFLVFSDFTHFQQWICITFISKKNYK